MLLMLDIGNTNITLGVYEGKKLLFVSRMATDRARMEDQYAIEIRDILDIYGVKVKDLDGCIISSVVPPLNTYIARAIKKLVGIEPVCVGKNTMTGLKVRIRNPETLGADLIAGSVGAAELYGGPCIVWDMGTATTVCVIDGELNMRGGCIIPGMAISMDALISRTAKLPAISLIAPKKIIGTNTVECMRAGILYGQASMVDGLSGRIEEELGTPCRIIATGGLAREVVPLCKRDIVLCDNLVLEGLRVIYEKNAPGAAG